MGTVSAIRSAWNATFHPSIEQIDACERRSDKRHEALLSAEVLSAGAVHAAQIRDISTSGLTLSFTSKPCLFKGAHLLVRAPGFAPISGAVRWVRDNECGMVFNIALAEDMLSDSSILFDAGKRPRPGRAKVSLPAVVRAPGVERKIMIDNISPGGALINCGLSLSVGRGIMLDIDGILPIGGYIRWGEQGRCGVMFSKLLPIGSAEEIANRCSIHPSWMSEVAAAHAALSRAD